MTPNEASEKMDAFLDSFSEDRDRQEDEPVKYNTDNVKLHNPEASGSGDIKKIDLDGDDIAGHELIEEQTEEGDYIIKGLTTRVNYKNEFFNVTVMGGEKMAYAKVEDVGDLELGKELMADIQDRYMEHFREY
ncbi:hypothetical protein CV102_17650 [Natronococcus pandeyae]|uniref:Uncharacterized protein n=2 Tax=Natronococcus pandeyae TaxID=2055836 RepID=A0A8J8TRC9_9EURY|nr:hypothetical protein CV102_17650 [Natronococcus pandeyae]